MSNPFSRTQRTLEGINLIHDIPENKCPLLLNRVIQGLMTKNTKIFTDDEEEKLIDLFDITLNNLLTILQFTSYVFETCAYHTLSTEKLNEYLEELGMEEGHINAYTTVWENVGPNYVSNLRNSQMGSGVTKGGSVLVGLGWNTHLMMSQGSLSRLKSPTAIFDFNLGTPADEAINNGIDNNEDDDNDDENNEKNEKKERNVVEKISVEFSHDELNNFFMDLERIQEQLDNLG